VLEIHSPYLAAVAALSVPRTSFGIRTFVWHADFIDTYLRGGMERRLPVKVVDAMVEPLWAWVRSIARACDATFAASKWQAEKLRAHGVERVTHLPFGVEKEIFSPDARSEETRTKLLRGKRGPLLVAIGRFAVEKRWDVVLDAFVQLKDKDAVLAIFGDGPDRAAMEARVRGNPNVHFMGFDKDRARLANSLASADVLVHGCPYETFGLGVAEAIATGLPVVVPDEGGAAEQAHPRSAELYRSGDATACVEAIERLLARGNLRQNALVTAAGVPSVETHFARLFEIYEELLSHPRS
jgi:alpha-1,6-mannosyltransferase